MAAASRKKKDQQDGLAQLVHALKSKTTLCRVKDYPCAKLEQLNQHLVDHGPLVNPVFGEQPAFSIDEGRFMPYRMAVYGRENVAAKIAQRLGIWAGGVCRRKSDDLARSFHSGAASEKTRSENARRRIHASR